MVEIVVGATFGDEGKGQVVHALCCDYIRECNDHPMVIRYSGGHQAGHTVTTSQGIKHVFSCFGSGTLANCPTFWNKNCVMDPIQWKFEKDLLITKIGRFGIPPQYFHPLVEITTPYDVFLNKDSRIGKTVGKGIWETVKRNRDGLHLFVQDLQFPEVTRTKLELIKMYSANRSKCVDIKDIDIDTVVDIYTKFFNSIVVDTSPRYYCDNFIYEGSQGILLDPKFGFSYEFTTPIPCRPNIDMLLPKPKAGDITINCVYRSYLTRHGDGPVPNSTINKIVNPYETNCENEFQGNFKTYNFNVNLVKYGITSILNEFDTKGISIWTKRRTIETCCDINNEHELDIAVDYTVHTYKPDFETCKQ